VIIWNKKSVTIYITARFILTKYQRICGLELGNHVMLNQKCLLFNSFNHILLLLEELDNKKTSQIDNIIIELSYCRHS